MHLVKLFAIKIYAERRCLKGGRYPRGKNMSSHDSEEEDLNEVKISQSVTRNHRKRLRLKYRKGVNIEESAGEDLHGPGKKSPETIEDSEEEEDEFACISPKTEKVSRQKRVSSKYVFGKEALSDEQESEGSLADFVCGDDESELDESRPQTRRGDEGSKNRRNSFHNAAEIEHICLDSESDGNERVRERSSNRVEEVPARVNVQPVPPKHTSTTSPAKRRKLIRKGGITKEPSLKETLEARRRRIVCPPAGDSQDIEDVEDSDAESNHYDDDLDDFITPDDQGSLLGYGPEDSQNRKSHAHASTRESNRAQESADDWPDSEDDIGEEPKEAGEDAIGVDFQDMRIFIHYQLLRLNNCAFSTMLEQGDMKEYFRNSVRRIEIVLSGKPYNREDVWGLYHTDASTAEARGAQEDEDNGERHRHMHRDRHRYRDRDRDRDTAEDENDLPGGDGVDGGKEELEEEEDFVVGRFCLGRSLVYHTLQHYQFHLVDRLHADLAAAKDFLRSHPSSGEKDPVWLVLKHPGLLEFLFQNLKKLIKLVETYLDVEDKNGHECLLDGLSISIESLKDHCRFGMD
eukprot:jgi/Mesen1/8547/ME000484S07935